MVGSSYLIGMYLVYTVVCVLLTGVLARTLFRHGAVFLEGVFDTSEMASAVNRLLVVGFYMLNMGYALLIFRTNEAATAVAATENLITKLGFLLVSLGVIHFLNLLVFSWLRGMTRQSNTLPASPQQFGPMPPIPVRPMAPQNVPAVPAPTV